MAYVQLDDYAYRITRAYLDSILAQAIENTSLTEDQVREDAEATAITRINSYLEAKYLMEDEFAKDATTIPDDRNKIIVKCVLDMTIFFIHYVINPRDVPETREKSYNSCIDELAAYRDGELTFSRPPAQGGIDFRPIDEGGTRRVNLYSDIKFISRPYNEIDPDLIFGEE